MDGEDQGSRAFRLRSVVDHLFPQSPVANLEKTFKDYNAIAAAKNDPYGKKFFHNVPFKSDDDFWVAHITPVL